MPTVKAYWVRAIRRERVWADGRKIHKMGWVDAGIRMRVVEEYKSWVRFDQHTGSEVEPFDDSYHEWWIEGDAVVEVDSPPPPPLPPSGSASDAELGAALCTIVIFLAEQFRSI